MSKPNEERDIYYIPPNFLASGRLFGGMIRARNAIEACVLVLLTGINEEQMHSIANELNLVSVTGWHSVFLADDSMIYMYRQCLWLSMSLTYEDLLTILKECISEYKRGKGRLTTGEYPTDPVA